MNEKFNISQLPFLIISYILGSTLIITLVDGISGRSSWLVMIAGFVLSIPFLLVFCALAKRFPGKNIAQMSELIFGKVIGTVVNVLFLCFFFLLFTFNIADISSFHAGYIMNDTPMMTLMIPFVLTCTLSVRRGVAALTKISVIAAAVSIFIVVLFTFALIPHINLAQFFPLFDKPLIRYAQATHITANLPILETLALLMVLPLARSQEKLTSRWITGVGVAMLLFTIIAARDTAVLGNAVDILGENSYEAIRLINIGDFLTRIDLLIALNYTASSYIKVCMLYYASVELLSHLLRVQKDTLILPVGMIGITVSAMKIRSAVQHSVWGAQYGALFSFPFLAVLPVLMLLVAAIRGFRVPPAEAQSLTNTAQEIGPKQKPAPKG